MSLFKRAAGLTFLAPLISPLAYFTWLAVDSGGFQPCSAASLNYGFIPLFVVPVAAVTAKATAERRRWPVVLGLTAVTAVSVAMLLAAAWFIWFAKNKCGE
jgi:hypothetical protein